MSETLSLPLITPSPQSDERASNKTTPTYLNEGYFNRIFFGWISRLIRKNKQKTFEQNMHHDLRQSEKSETQYKILQSNWLRMKTQKKFTLLRTIFSAYISHILLVGLLGLMKSILFFSSPITINLLMRYIAEPHPTIGHVLFLLVFIPCSRLVNSLIDSNTQFLLNVLGVKVKYGLAALIYWKTLKISIIRSKSHSVGSIINHYEIDCEKLRLLMTMIQDLFIIPIQLMIGIGIIYYLVGNSFLAGLGMMGIVSGIAYILTSKSSRLQEAFMIKKDARAKLISEILNGIKYIKMSGWEGSFIKKVENSRREELRVLKERFQILTLYNVNYLLGPQGVLMATLGMYLLQGNEFDVTKIITLSSTFWVLATPFQQISKVVSTLVDSNISMKRLEKFLSAEEIDQSYIKQDYTLSNPTALKISNGNFSWKSTEKKTPEATTKIKILQKDSNTALELTSNMPPNDQLKDLSETLPDSASQNEGGKAFRLQEINLEIQKGAFVAIIGDVGSGKSSLFYSLVGEMGYSVEDPPEVYINGSMAFLPQKPWIINATLRENILFGKPYSEELYNAIISYAALEADLKVLTHGDMTEIGEKGINLSGGQKARVGLARALYSQPDIFILDDILSAVDVHVGTQIIEKCLKGYLAGKTRVLITHNLDYLKYVDYIYMMDAGKIVGQGPLEYLKTTKLLKDLIEKSQKLTREAGFSQEDAEEEEKIGEIEVSTNKKHVLREDQLEPGLKQAGLIKTVSSQEDKIQQAEDQLIIEEDREKGSIKASTIKTFIQCWGGLKVLALILLVSLIKELSIQGCWIYLAHWGTYSDHTAKYKFLTNYYMINVNSLIFQGLTFGLIYYYSLKSSETLHGKMIKAVIEAPLNLFFDRVPSGRILNRFSDDIDKVDVEMPWSVGLFSASALLITINLIICVTLSNILMVFPVAGFLIICHCCYQDYTSLNREILRLKSISNSPIVSHFTETLQGLSVIRSFHQEKQFFENQLKKQDETIKNLIVSNVATQWYDIRCCMASMLIIAPVSAIILVWKQEIGISMGFAGVLATYLINSSRQMSWFLKELASMEARLISLERCHKYTMITPEKITPEHSNQPQNLGVWPAKGEIKFENYSAKYRPGLPFVLKQLNFSVNPGEKVGIVGRTGSGKSTLMLSLLRIIEVAEGTIKIDDVRLDDIALPRLREKITVISQDPQIFEGTLRENLDILGEYDDETIKRALEMVNLNSLTNSSKSLDMNVKNGGENFSAGERQMICIARALLKKNKIVLIDEATSNIDMNNEEIFLRTITERFRDSTVLTIAHRLNTIINSDKIIVMDQGNVIEMGSPEELLKIEKGVFSNMWSEAKRAKKYKY